MGIPIKEIQMGLKAAALAVFSRDAAARYLAESLGSIPGLPAKAAQILSTKSKIEIHQPEPLPLEVALTLIEERSPKLAGAIRKINPAFTTASLGQVHEAWLSDGRHIAVKIQWPNIPKQLQIQARRLLYLGRLSPASRFGLDWIDYETTIKSLLKDEANYLNEMSNQKAAYDQFIDDIEIIIPKVIDEFSTDNILVQEFESSTSFERIEELDSKAQVELLGLLKSFLSKSLLNPGVFHSDLQPKNLGFRTEPTRLVVYDFGSMIPISSERAAAFRNLKKAAENQNIEEVALALADLDFEREKLDRVRSLLISFARSLFQKEDLKSEIEKHPDENKWWLRTAGPAWFLFAMRSFFYLNELRAKLTQNTITKKSPAKSLFVRVSQSGETLVEIELPASAADRLSDLISPDILQKIESHDLDFGLIQARLKESNYEAQSIFEYRDEKKEYRVWLK